ncbi:hypothetical protein [Fodinicola acaciae]|uniref:hypothetical protein n=1 Tax=Fodinicola acaciae TaxID=2681555 RepID=UPI0013D6CDBA|nr:hypothetical protein [Fodinicola acaciae]
MNNLPSYAYAILGVVLIAFVIVRQVSERRMTIGKLAIMPIVFVALPLLQDHDLGHRLVSSPLAIPLLLLGLLVGAGTGWLRAMTMSVRLEGSTLITKGSWKTVGTWVALIGLRLGVAGLAYLLGVKEGMGEALFCAAASFGVQNLVLAYRAGLLSLLKAA